MTQQHSHHTSPKWFLFLLIPVFILNSCTAVGIGVTPTATPQPAALSTQPTMAEIGFSVQIPAALASDQKLSVEMLDEVTGIALNPQRFTLNAVDETHYSLVIPLQVGSVIKYRYIREGNNTAFEYTTQAQQVRYRLFHIINPAIIQDVVAAWIDKPYTGVTGRIQGRVTNASDSSPIPAGLVAAGGQQTLTASDGSFMLEGLPPGTHNLVVYSLDGSFSPFQQGATVAENSATPAEIVVNPSEFIKVTFVVQPPDGTPRGIPIRLIGNIYPLGNTFADLRGGMNSIASRAPLLTLGDDGKYTLTLSLPVGLDLRYKYTLGDGFWNAELTTDGAYHLRQLIVPGQDSTVEDTIASFTTTGKGLITFSVTVPADTPPDDTISIQFNPYGWTEPIPMWPMGNNNWVYILYNPLNLIGDSVYRYCRNSQCGIADDIATSGPDTTGKPFTPTADAQAFKDTVKQWTWTLADQTAISVTSDPITVRPAGFTTSVELLPDYHPSWQPYYTWAFQNISSLRANSTIITPTWHFTNTNPPVISPVAGVDASWYDLNKTVTLARQNNLKIAIHPQASYTKPAFVWWSEGKRDADWWQSWFDRYETFIINYADFAEQAGAETLILGDDSLLPSLPGGKLPDGSSSGVPGNAAERWNTILKNVRTHYKGTVAWYLKYPADFANLPAILNDVDQIYIVLDGPVTQSENPTSDELSTAIGQIIQRHILAVHDRFKKPVIIGISYPSAKGAAAGCVKSAGACLPQAVLSQGGLEIPSAEIDLKIQADLYNAFYENVSKTDWISGVFASGYYPPVSIADKSTSIRGKPAADVTWFYFDHFIGPSQ
jgi:hypothetical protein